MNILNKGILPKNFIVSDKYNILLFIKQSIDAETYRVKGNDGKLYFLKLFIYSKLKQSAFDCENNLLEIEFLKSIKHPNIVNYIDSGELIYNGDKFCFLVLNFITGETLAERITREPITSIYDVKQIAKGVLNGLNYLHSLSVPIIHNEITSENIMLDLSGENLQSIIIDFGYAYKFQHSTNAYEKEGLNLYYMATECFDNQFSPQTDLFSVGALMYQLLFGIPPWFKSIDKYDRDQIKFEEIIREERKKPLFLPNIKNKIVDYDELIIEAIKRALHQDPEKRFQSAMEFLQVLNDKDEEISNNFSTPTVKKGRGFSAIAGMKLLKDQLQNDVLNLIENPEEYKRHNLGLPNGMLLYGPPGCGKTFFAERFAEEAGYNFIKVISSDIASIYIHGSQEKIGKLFKEARAKAPIILYFDELEAMVPNRESIINQGQSGEVNEFLSQLDNIGDSGVFVIGSSNKPDSIDKAILRAGRLEKWFFIPPPDYEARKAMFELYLKERPIESGIDYDKLATITENYVSSDIKFIIDESSRKTIRDKTKNISMETLKFVIDHQKPTVSLSELKKYESIRRKIENETDNSDNRTRIGFKPVK